MYGTAMPYLYFCALLAFVILYINERLLVCYYYQEPPAFDEKMTLMTLQLTKCVPLMMLPMVFWQLGNRQIFDNKVEEIVYKTDVQASGHSLQQAMTHANPLEMTWNSAPFICFALLVLYSLVNCIWGSEEEEEEDDGLVEGLDEYYNALKSEDIDLIRG